MADLQETTLPMGWECKMDHLTGKYYFVNHATKTTTWEDPRSNRVYHQTRGTPKLFSNVNVEYIPLQDFRSAAPRGSPLTVRSQKMVQESPLMSMTSSPINCGQSEATDDVVAKISAMFPTVSDTHIRLLMRKYHNREALVISALQVEKNPITTPGPTPPPQRNIQRVSGAGQHHVITMTPPLGGLASNRGSPRPHSSPKLKLRYMKSIFPQAEETIILEALYSNESNIQKTSELLKDMGFQRKDTVKAAQQKRDEEDEEKRRKDEEERLKREREEEARQRSVCPPVRKVKSAEEKAALIDKLKQKYNDTVQDHLIAIALESVDYNENRANQILEIMVQEEEDGAREKEVVFTPIEEEGRNLHEVDSRASTLPISQSRQSIKSVLKSSDKVDGKEKNKFFHRVIEECTGDYQSLNIMSTKGANPDFSTGPNHKNLLEDYVKWQGPNAGLRKGPQGLAKGSNSSLLFAEICQKGLSKSYMALGSNPEMRKGPQCGLAKGSIFKHFQSDSRVLVHD